MPSKSKNQHNAMAAACYGHSTLGIPKKVGCEFAKADMYKSRHGSGGHRKPKEKK